MKRSPTTEVCKVCSGDRKITYNEYTFNCPKCGGKGIYVSGTNRTDIYKVSDAKAITSIKIDVKHNNNVEILYRLGYEFCNENDIFTSLSDAEDCCRTSEKALKKQHFISLIKMWIFEKFNKEKNMEKTEKVNQYFY